MWLEGIEQCYLSHWPIRRHWGLVGGDSRSPKVCISRVVPAPPCLPPSAFQSPEVSCFSLTHHHSPSLWRTTCPALLDSAVSCRSPRTLGKLAKQKPAKFQASLMTQEEAVFLPESAPSARPHLRLSPAKSPATAQLPVDTWALCCLS